jgi:thiol:disulfide interchange protein DsbA
MMRVVAIVLLVLFFLVACGKEQNSISETEQKQSPKLESSAPKNDSNSEELNQAHSENDSHAGHDHAQQTNPNELPYIELDTPYATENDSKVVVYEFFGYLCGHCNNFEPQMSKWVENKPEYVEIVRVPLNFQQGWDVLQQGYLTAKSMGIADKTHSDLFAAIHKQRKSFRTIEDLASWYADNTGVSKEEFLSTAQSFIIDSQQRKADKMGYQMKVTGTPTIVVNGKYKPTNNQKSREDVLLVMTELVEKEAKQMGLIK